jgi:lysophospholipase L1-like esterase
MFVKTIIKIFTTNIIILLISITSIEIFFGYWFDNDNFGPYMHEHRMKNQRILWENEEEKISYFYRRNYYGFRGADINPAEIQGVILGGSVIDERYKPEQYTITEFLNNKLKKNNLNIKFINGGIEAQSTVGMVSGFNNWLFKLENFSPKFIVFYIGINDVRINDNILENPNDGFILNPNKKEIFFDNIKSRSILLDSARKFKFKYLPRKGFVKYDGKLSEDYVKNYNFIKYDYAKDIYNSKFLKEKYKKKIDNYLSRIDLLEKYSRKINAIPIFINNIGSVGHEEVIFLMNKSLIDHCFKKKYNCIDLARKLDPKIDFWIDGSHTTKKGSKAIAETIFPNLKKIIATSN